jgi:tetratricopeptide (TPR) repeat protein
MTRTNTTIKKEPIHSHENGSKEEVSLSGGDIAQRVEQYRYKLNLRLIRMIQRAIASEPVDQETWICLGDVYREVYACKQAINAYEKAITLNRKNPFAWRRLSSVLDDAGKYRKSDQALDRARWLETRGTTK